MRVETGGYGSVTELGDGRWQLRFVRLLPHGQEKVWRAITEPEHLAYWFPTTIDGERASGASLRFDFREHEAEPMDGEMLAFEPMSVMELRWGEDLVRFELRPADGGTELMLLDTLDQRGKAARDGAGWHTCLDALDAHLEGDPNSREAMNAWNEVQPHYVERFGPEGSTIGPPPGFE